METTTPAVKVDHPEPPSPVVKELLEAFRDPNLDMDHVVELIAGEPALSAEILRRGNSVMFGGKEPTNDVFAAFTRIGINEAYRALVALLI